LHAQDGQWLSWWFNHFLVSFVCFSFLILFDNRLGVSPSCASPLALTEVVKQKLLAELLELARKRHHSLERLIAVKLGKKTEVEQLWFLSLIGLV
jgi:hypothetical protein